MRATQLRVVDDQQNTPNGSIHWELSVDGTVTSIGVWKMPEDMESASYQAFFSLVHLLPEGLDPDPDEIGKAMADPTPSVDNRPENPGGLGPEAPA